MMGRDNICSCREQDWLIVVQAESDCTDITWHGKMHCKMHVCSDLNFCHAEVIDFKPDVPSCAAALLEASYFDYEKQNLASLIHMNICDRWPPLPYTCGHGKK